MQQIIVRSLSLCIARQHSLLIGRHTSILSNRKKTKVRNDRCHLRNIYLVSNFSHGIFDWYLEVFRLNCPAVLFTHKRYTRTKYYAFSPLPFNTVQTKSPDMVARKTITLALAEIHSKIFVNNARVFQYVFWENLLVLFSFT